MSELEQLKKRIKDAGLKGVPTAQIRDDYEPIGQVMINDLCATGEYVTQREVERSGLMTGPWKIWERRMVP